ncbi:hypothetical protein JCM15519_38760 [Fundidesulfovibrio butyratiphilus]
MGAQQFKIMVVLGKLHNPGEEVTPLATDALRVDADVECAPDGEKIERNIVSRTFSKEGSRIGAKSQKFTIKHEACGAGLDGTGAPLPPYYDGPLQACGMARADGLLLLTLSDQVGTWTVGETISGGDPVVTGVVRFACGDLLVLEAGAGEFAAADALTGGTSAATATVVEAAKTLEYTPVTQTIAQQKCMTYFFHRDGVRKRLRDARGSWSLDCPSGQIAKFTFTFQAAWLDPADQPLPNPTLPDIVPAVFTDAHATLGAFTPAFTQLKLDLANEVNPRKNANAVSGISEYYISGRNPTGSLDPEMDDLSNFNPYALWSSSTPSGLVARIGQTAGNRLIVAVPKLRVTSISERERSGLGAYDLPFEATRDVAGDDEFRLYFA